MFMGVYAYQWQLTMATRRRKWEGCWNGKRDGMEMGNGTMGICIYPRLRLTTFDFLFTSSAELISLHTHTLSLFSREREKT